VSDHNLLISDFANIFAKTGKSLDPWCIVWAGFYMLKDDGAHQKMEIIRAKFLWQGAEHNFKYHMAKWEMVTRSKVQGGLGVTNSKL